jgi:hypothetical protein
MGLWNVGILPQHYTALEPRKWRQHGPLKRRYPTTTLYSVTTQKMEAALTSETSVSYHNTIWRHNPEYGGSMDLWNVGILPQHYMASKPRRWRQHGPLKRRYPTTTLYSVTTQKMEAALTSETSVSYQHYMASQPRIWRQHVPLKRRYPTTTLYGVINQKTSIGSSPTWKSPKSVCSANINWSCSMLASKSSIV